MSFRRLLFMLGLVLATLALVCVIVAVPGPQVAASGVAGAAHLPAPVPTLPPTATPTPAPPEPVSGLLLGGPGDQDHPRIDGNVVVVEDNSTGNWDIIGVNFSGPGRPLEIYRGPADQRYPAISGDLVVWQDNRSGDWDIYGEHLADHIVFPIFVGPGDQTNPRVSGNRVVWQSTSPGATRSDIMSLTLPGGQAAVISDPALDSTNPAVDGNVAVWQSNNAALSGRQAPAATNGWDVLGFDFATGGAIVITNDPGDQTEPDIADGIVVWVDGPAAAKSPAGTAPSKISGKPVGSGGTFTVINDGKNNTNPSTKGGGVSFTGKPPYTGPGTVKSYDPNSHQIKPVSFPGKNAGSSSFGSGKHIVWKQNSPNGDADIYGNTCGIGYSDVNASDYFYVPIQWLSCNGVVSGYADNTFRPFANTTRGQLAKIVVLGEGWPINTTGGPHFTDVSTTNPFYGVIETAFNRGIISGYADGTFRWGADVTRGQLAKIVVGAQGWAINTAGGPHFLDVDPTNPFYGFIETAYNHGAISGYADGTYRWGANAIRGQITKIVYNALGSP